MATIAQTREDLRIRNCRLLTRHIEAVRASGRLSKGVCRALPVERWIRIRLPMRATRARLMAQEDFTRSGTAKLVHHTYQV